MWLGRQMSWSFALMYKHKRCMKLATHHILAVKRGDFLAISHQLP